MRGAMRGDRVPQLADDVQLPKIEIHVTESCNNRCGFCTTGWLNAEDAPEARGHVPRARIREQLAEGRRRGARRALFQGGEPTVRRDLGDLLGDAHALGYEATTIFTNARMAASTAGAKWLADMGVTWFQVSIQGGDAPSHDASVGATPAFKQTVAGVRRLLGHGQRVKINSVLTIHLLESLEAWAALMIDLRPEEIGLDTVKPGGALGPGRARYGDLVPNMAPYAERLREAVLAVDRAGICVRLTSFPFCLAPGVEHLVNEERPTTLSAVSTGRILDKHLWKRSMMVKAPACSACAYEASCPGVYADYAEAHGVDHLRPYGVRRADPFASDEASDEVTPLREALRALFVRGSGERFGVRDVLIGHAGGWVLSAFGPRGDLEVLLDPRDDRPAFASTERFSVRYREGGSADPRVLDAIVRALSRNEARLPR